MKVLKGIFLVIIVIIMCTMLTLLQFQFVISQTFLSSNYFDKMYDRSDLNEAVSDIIVEAADEIIVEVMGTDNQYSSADFIDEDDLTEVVEETIKGFYSYFTGEDDNLPELNVEPIKEMMLELVTQALLADEETADMLVFIADNFALIGGAFTEETVSEYLPSYATDYMTAEVLEIITDTIEQLDEDLTSDEKATIIIEATVKAMLDYDNISDSVDLDEIAEDTYDDDENPFLAIRNMVAAIKETLAIALFTMLIMLVLIVVLTAFRPAPMFGWLSAPLVLCGLPSFLFGLFGMISPILANYATVIDTDIAGASADYFTAFIQNYLSGFSVYFLALGGAMLVLGIIFIVLAAVISGNAKKQGKDPKKQTGAIIAIRVVVVVVLLVAVFITFSHYFSEIFDTIEDASQTLKDTFENEETVFVNAIFEDINFNLGDISSTGE